jgi:hypothetical protein
MLSFYHIGGLAPLRAREQGGQGAQGLERHAGDVSQLPRPAGRRLEHSLRDLQSEELRPLERRATNYL